MQVDCLKISVSPHKEELGRLAAKQAALIIAKTAKHKDSVNVMFAAAVSQMEFFKHLLMENLPWEKITAFHMDEYISLDQQDPRGFGAFLYRNLFSKRPFRRIHYINSLQSSPEQARSSYEKLLHSHALDLVCMGVGENGHIAFNDPPQAQFDDPLLVRIVALEQRCRIQQVNDGCFPSLSDVPETAVTVTIPALMSARHIVCVVPGRRKAEAVCKMLSEEISPGCPASILRIHKNASMFLDVDSASSFLLAKKQHEGKPEVQGFKK